jgi:uncharacterized protein
MITSAPVVFKGIMFPFQKGVSSFPAGVTDDELIKDSVVQLLMTAVGERIMRPDLGSNVHSLIFENNDVVLGNLVRSEVQGVLAKFEPRIQLVDVQVEQQDSAVILTIVYVVLSTRRSGAVSIGVPTL